MHFISLTLSIIHAASAPYSVAATIAATNKYGISVKMLMSCAFAPYSVAATIAATNYSRMTSDILVLLFNMINLTEFSVARIRNPETAREIISAIISYVM